MGRVSKEVLELVIAAVSDLPKEIKSKCALCNDTLTHHVTSIQAKTGAGLETVTNELTKQYNQQALPGDGVSGTAFKARVQHKTGADGKSIRYSLFAHYR